MADSPKDRARKACEKFFAKQLDQESKPKRTNLKPEKDVEQECVHWMRAQGWDVQIYESKSTYDPSRERYISQSMKAGNFDCQGNTNLGHSVYVEFKAKGKLSTFALDKNHRQQTFAKKKIDSNCFVAVTDSKERLEKIYDNWLQTKAINERSAKAYLHSMLPVKTKEEENDPLFT